jgi:hypothetical protein
MQNSWNWRGIAFIERLLENCTIPLRGALAHTGPVQQGDRASLDDIDPEVRPRP